MVTRKAHLQLLGAAAVTVAPSIQTTSNSRRDFDPGGSCKRGSSAGSLNACRLLCKRGIGWLSPIRSCRDFRTPLFAEEHRPTHKPAHVLPRKRVCCIGAGAAGLACAKEMLERGFDTTVLESREGIGGVWRLDKSAQHVGVRTGQRATSSKYYLGFSDYPMPDVTEDFPSNTEYLRYLDSYADTFGIREHILFGHRTTDVNRIEDSKEWEVCVALPCGHKKRLRFDAVAVCSGLHTVPDFPLGVPVPPQGFKTSIVHSKELKDAETFLRGQRVVVMGGGETGAELAHLAATVGATPAFFSLRRGITIIGSYLPLPLEGRIADSRTPPVDLNERRIVSLLPPSLKHFVFTRSGVFELRDEHPGKYTVTRLVASLCSKAVNIVVLPFLIAGSAASEVVDTMSKPQFWSLSKPDCSPPDGVRMSMEMARSVSKLPLPTLPSHGPRRDTTQLTEYMNRASDFYTRGFTIRHYREIRSLLEEYSGARHGSNFFTKTDDVIYDILNRSLEVRPGISRFEGTNTVVFDNGSRAEVDVIVCCTGYQPKLPFLDCALRKAGTEDESKSRGQFLDGQRLYKHVFHPKLGDSIAFIGFARPQIGAMPPIAELQARWFGAVLSGAFTLPNNEAMEMEVLADCSKFEADKIFSNRLRSSVDFAKYTSELARKAGCYPSIGLQILFSDPLLWKSFWLGPVLPQSYRIAEDGPRGDAARATMRNVYQTFLTRD